MLNIEKPSVEELEPELKQVIRLDKPKMLLMLAKGMAPLPPTKLVPAWCYLVDHDEDQIAQAARDSLAAFPTKNLQPILKTKLPEWALFELGKAFKGDDAVLEQILLNENAPNELFMFLAKDCSETIATLMVNNQERMIDMPEIITLLEANPKNLKSNTDRLRQFLKLAGVYVPGDVDEAVARVEQEEQTDAGDEQKIDEADAEELAEEAKVSLHKFVSGLSVGAKVKLSVKGNKECRMILIKDTNKTVSTAVLKNPRITDNEVVHYAGMKNVAEDVIRGITRNPQWCKLYAVKLALLNHPKTPLQSSMQYLKFINLRDLTILSKTRTIPGPLQKAAKQLLATKRR